jgi:hypothetical protein
LWGGAGPLRPGRRSERVSSPDTFQTTGTTVAGGLSVNGCPKSDRREETALRMGRRAAGLLADPFPKED